MSKTTKRTKSKKARTSKSARGGIRVAQYRLRNAPSKDEG
jgi:hypothetical protein